MITRCIAPLLALASVVVTVGCDGCVLGTTGPEFDAERAWTHLEKQVALGPRPSGTTANESCRAYIEDQLKQAGLEPKRDAFTAKTPAGDVAFVNVYADLKGSDPAQGTIIVGSHYDTKRLPNFVGANDGGSSTAVLLEVARIVASRKHFVGYRFLFLDGEEAVNHDWIGDDNTYGSRHHAAALKASGEALNMRLFVLLDMVGDKDLVLTHDQNSDRRVLEMFYAAARDAALGAHVDGKSMDVRDDHIPFMAAGIRSIDLIDLDYGKDNRFWHTPEDNLANCSKASLAAIGKITLGGLAAFEKSLNP